METIIFMDLDDTIFQTRRKCSDEGPLTIGAVNKDGEGMSFLTPRQLHFYSFFQEYAILVPTTARDLSSFNRVHLSFSHGAILDFGGLILTPDAQIDLFWQAKMRQSCSESAVILAAAKIQAEAIINREKLACRARIINDHGLDFYLVVKNFDEQVEQLQVVKAVLSDYLEWPNMLIHLNDNNLVVRPSFLNKGQAVAYFLDAYIRPKYQNFMTIGLGDSLSDLDFMKLCHYQIIPADSQIGKSLKP